MTHAHTHMYDWPNIGIDSRIYWTSCFTYDLQEEITHTTVSIDLLLWVRLRSGLFAYEESVSQNIDLNLGLDVYMCVKCARYELYANWWFFIKIFLAAKLVRRFVFINRGALETRRQREMSWQCASLRYALGDRGRRYLMWLSMSAQMMAISLCLIARNIRKWCGYIMCVPF